MPHRLDPLLRPGSVAVVGGTERPGSVGRQTLENLLQGQFPGRLFAVNPGYDSVLGVDCYPTLAALPEPVEHVIFAISDTRLEAALDEAIDHGVRAVTVMSGLVLAEDQEPLLRQRFGARIKESGLLVCGPNGMGFYNFRDGIWACGFDTRAHRSDGVVTLISHSGSGMAGIVDVDERIDFNLVVSTGEELNVGMHDYLDFSLELPETKVIGLFMETVRDPEAMIRVLQKANSKGVPVIALKVGRTELSARLALSHSGAIAGRDAAYQAFFDRYGVQRVNDMDELATALIMFAQPHPIPDGGLASIHDSGGERQLLIDLADEVGVSLAALSADSVSRLQDRLDPGLPPVNPLDAWGAGGADADQMMADCFSILMADPNTAMGAVVHDRASGGEIYTEYADYIRQAHQQSGKPAFLVANRQGTGADALVQGLTREGFPVLDGLRSFLVGARCLLAYRDFCRLDRGDHPPQPVADSIVRWQARLADGGVFDEAEAGRLAADFGLTMNTIRSASDESSVVAAATELGFPVVLKSAQPGLLHKSEKSGVKLNLANDDELKNAYRDICNRLGPQVTVAPMITAPGVEMLLGLIRDEQFGPLVILGFGGVHVEINKDVAYALPPFSTETARRLVDSLRMRPLLDGQRGMPCAAVDVFCAEAAKFSQLAAALGESVEEIDLNPVIVHAGGCIAVDALVVGRKSGKNLNEQRQVG